MDQILAESAFRLFCLHGIARVTMDDIAADAGVTKGSLYWHYRSKAEVIEAACRHYYDDWHARMRRVTARIPGAAGKERIDLMLATMEGYKSRALFEPELCAQRAEARIARELLEIVGLERTLACPGPDRIDLRVIH